MKLLICTQVVDSEDVYLGFFVRWIAELSKHYECVHVICLKEGKHALPKNVFVHSLGKESGESRIKYLSRFYRYIWSLRREYDAVFVHMNQEYVLLGAKLWLVLQKPIFMWRNHNAGSLLTDIAVLFCHKVFCTSKYSYTAKYRKTTLMPIGVDTDLFKFKEGLRDQNSVLSLGRISEAKRPEMLIEALSILQSRGIACTASFYGPGSSSYIDALKTQTQECGVEDRVTFFNGVPHTETSQIYARHLIYVNAATSGMYDKAIFEAAASGCIVFAASRDFVIAAGEDLAFSNASELAEKLARTLSLPAEAWDVLRARLQKIAQENSLHTLVEQLVVAI